MKTLMISALLLTLLACSTVPITGRSQLILINKAEMLPMSFSNYSEVMKTSKLSTDAKKVALVKKVGKNIQNAVERYFAENNMSDQLAGFEWEFNLIEENSVNAWCMPGGKVAFYTGILPVCKDEAGVAVVMGHEVAHAIARHGNERMSQGMLQQVGAAALQEAIAEKSEETQSMFMTAYGVGSNLLGVLPYGRLQESEADKMGLVFMAMAGYDPNTAPAFWERMAASSNGQEPPQFLSTHPSHDTRIKDLKKEIPKAMKYYSK